MDKESEHDLFICGGCKQQFTELLIFFDHKTSLACKKVLGGEEVEKLAPSAPRKPGPVTLHEAMDSFIPADSQSSPVRKEYTTPLILSRVTTANPAAKSDFTKSPTSMSALNKCTVDDRKRFVCGVENCTFRTAYLKDLHRHHRKHTGEKPFACDICGSSFARLDKLLTHKRIHSGEKPYKCSLCDYSCVEKGSLSKHSRVHNGERPFKCQLCTYSAKDASQLTIHLRVHTGDAPYSCPCAPCSKTFKTQSDLKRHIRLHTGEKPFACSMCDYKCAISSNLKVHIRHSHVPKKPFECTKCDFTSENKREYKNHVRIHSDQFVCELCDFRATEVEEYKLHFKTKHNSKPYTCRFCPATFMQLHVMRLHIRKEHPEFTSAAIPKSKGSNLKIVVAEQNPKPYACSQCPMSFVVEDSLKSHLRMHTHIQAPTQYKTIPTPAPKAPGKPTTSAVNTSSPLLVSVNGQLSRVLAVLPSRHNDSFPIEPKEATIMSNHSNLLPAVMHGNQSAATSQLGSVIVTYMPTGHNQAINAGPDSSIITSLDPSSNQELSSNLTTLETSLSSDVLLSVTDETGKIRYVYPRNLIAFKDSGDVRVGPNSLEAVIHMTVGEGAEPTQLTS